MHDTDFQDSPPKSFDPGGSFDPPTSRMAVMSLIFGILGFLVLPLLGPVFAITTGHLALSEIRTRAGTLGGRSLAKAGLILGYAWFALLIVVGMVAALYFSQRTFDKPIIPSPAPFLKPGVKMVNEMSKQELEKLRALKLPDHQSHEEVICTYNDPTLDDGEPEMAVLTTRRIVYLKGDRLTSFDLKDIDSVLDNGEYQQKYTPNYVDSSQYRIEIKRQSGGRMRIIIKPAQDGPTFYEALLDAWKAAGGKPMAKKAS